MSEKLKTIIVEDEELARNLMKSFLNDIEKIELIAECENGFEGVKAINEMKPDLVQKLDDLVAQIIRFWSGATNNNQLS